MKIGPLFIKEMPSLTLTTGRTTYIPCMYGGYPVDQVTWKKNAKDLISTKQQSSSTRPGRYSVLSNGTLRIELIDERSKGQYTCVVSNRKGEMTSGTVNINVMSE